MSLNPKTTHPRPVACEVSPIHRPLAFIGRFAARVIASRSLGRLDDHMLRDMGLHRRDRGAILIAPGHGSSPGPHE